MPSSSDDPRSRPPLDNPSTGSPPRFNCDAEHHHKLKLEPFEAGPLSLGAVYFQVIPEVPFTGNRPIVSSDARSIAYTSNDNRLWIARLEDRSTWHSIDIDLGGSSHFGAEYDSARAFAWASNSQFLWTATQETESRHVDPRTPTRICGFATAPMLPARAELDGRLNSLPPLSHVAGPLDALLWAGGDGLAIAQFGTHGGHYRPEHDDQNPTLAIVDAVRGLVLDTLPFRAIEPQPSQIQRGAPWTAVRQAHAIVLPDGRVRSFISFEGQWVVVWTQDQRPVVLPDPYADALPVHLALSPDGSVVLIGRQLRTHNARHIRNKGIIPGAPVEGVLVALHEVETGRELWTIRATATYDFRFPAPAISPDGCTALVGLMPTGGAPPIGLISIQNGKVLQTLPAPGGHCSFGFARSGQTVWTHANGVTALYDVRAT